MWLAATFFAAILLAASFAFLPRHLRKFKSIQKLSGQSKALSRAIIILPLVVAAAFLALDTVNTAIFLIHLMAFWAVADLIGFTINKVRGTNLAQKERYTAGAVAIVLTMAYFSWGVASAYNVQETHYDLTTGMAVAESQNPNGEASETLPSLRILQISDSHLGTTFDGEGFAAHLQKAEQCNPDVVVVTGDLVDDGSTKADMLVAAKALGKMKSTYGTYFVFGNHDKGYFGDRDFSGDELVAALEQNGVTVLQDQAVPLGDGCVLVGRQDKSERHRASMEELMKLPGVDQGKYVVVLDHQPSDYAAQEAAKVNLVLSGHTHGGQMPPVGLIGEISGMNDATYGLEHRGNTDFIVNSGISDWALKFKMFTVSEYGVIDITPTK